MSNTIRLTEAQHIDLMEHLHSGDGKEAVAMALCGRCGENKRTLLVHKIVPIPYEDCSVRESDRVTWSSDLLPPLLEEARKNNWGVVKFHSHPGGYLDFSDYDNESDRLLFPRLYDWIGTSHVHASVIVTPDGKMNGRIVYPKGDFLPIKSIWLIGSDIKQLSHSFDHLGASIPAFGERISQTFGDKTFSILEGLKVAVVGCSGTGGPVIEQLVRNCVGELILVDPDYIDEGNLNRIPNSKFEDAVNKIPKVEMHSNAINSIGLNTKVTTFNCDLFNPGTVRALSDCDVIFGCMDTVDGRHLLNKIATYYLVPYFDVGVKLVADGSGGISQVCCQTHYLQPGLSTLYSRKVYTMEQLQAAALYRTDLSTYEAQKKEGYIDGVNVDKPAVVSVNTLAASIAVNDLLARLHPYRRADNAKIATTMISLTDMFMAYTPESGPCEMLFGCVGLGDTPLLLNTPELSEVEQ
jgi:proteasome lid subunit RPN8/RPN11